MANAADDKMRVINMLMLEGKCASVEPITSASAPARLDVSGGMASHTGGVVAQCTMGMRAIVAAARREDGQLWICTCRAHEEQRAHKMFEMRTILHSHVQKYLFINQATSSTWFNLAISAVRHIGRWMESTTTPLPHHGISIGIYSDVALRGSIAGSNAVATAIVQCLCDHYKISVSPIEKASMVAGMLVDIGIKQAHTVDALTALCAPAGTGAYLLRYRCQPHQLLGPIPIAGDVQLLAIELASADTAAVVIAQQMMTAGQMGMRVIQTVYRDLGLEPDASGYLGNISPGLYKRYFRALLARRMRGRDFVRTYGELQGAAIDLDHVYHVRAAADHLIGEGEYAENFLQTMEQLAPNSDEPLIGPARILSKQRAGRLLLASQHSYRLRLGLSSAHADWIIARLTDAATGCGAYGARVTELGDGSLVVALAPNSSEATDQLLGVISEYGREFGASPHIYRTGGMRSGGALLN